MSSLLSTSCEGALLLLRIVRRHVVSGLLMGLRSVTSLRIEIGVTLLIVLKLVAANCIVILVMNIRLL